MADTSSVGHIFISYPHSEMQFTSRLAVDLRNAGVHIWMDILDGGIKSGDDWRRAIAEGVDDSAAIIPILSPDYLQSDYCRKELARADRMKRRIFPVLLRPIPEARDWPIEVESIQYTDFRDWQDESVYRQQFEALVRELKAKAADQIGAVPSAAVQYLTSLIAELESRKGVLEYVELTAQADAPERPNPHRDTSGWDASFSVIASQDVGTRHVASDPTPQKISLNSIADAVAQHPRFVLIGEPGAGKTTTLRRLVLDAARKRLDDANAPLPVLLYLPTWGDEPTPADFIQSRTGDVGANRRFAPTDSIFLYLDGLNEMGAAGVEKAKKLREWLHSGDAPNHVIVTCRAGDYAGDLDLKLPTVLAEEMKEPQIRQFAANYLSEETTPKFLARVLPEKVKDREDARHLFRLARNPYMLAALIFVYISSPDGDLPRNTGALMRMLALALWERERQRDTPGWIPFEEMEAAFAHMAFAMVGEDKPIDVSLDYVLKHLGGEELLRVGQSANFMEVRGDEARFYHQLIQEYFAAVKLNQVGVKAVLRKPSYGWGGETIKKWDNVIIAMCGANDANSMIEQIGETDPYLAARCVSNGKVSITTKTWEKIIDRITSDLRSQNELISSYAAKMLKEMREFNVGLLFQLLRDENSSVRRVAVELLSEISDIAITSVLVEVLRDKDSEVRWSAGNALERARWQPYDDEDEATYYIALQQWSECIRLGPFTVPFLSEMFKDQDRAIREKVADTLEAIGDVSAVPALIDALQDKDSFVRGAVVRALGTLADESAVSHLVARLADNGLSRSNLLVSTLAAEALEHIGTPEALTAVKIWRIKGKFGL